MKMSASNVNLVEVVSFDIELQVARQPLECRPCERRRESECLKNGFGVHRVLVNPTNSEFVADAMNDRGCNLLHNF